jgi:hypothetical protein
VVASRQTFTTSREREYFQLDTLQTQTGQEPEDFAAVIIKELMDNALDAAETAGVVPKIMLDVNESDDNWVITVSDNGGGIPPEVVERICDFSVLVSDKAAYVSPTRGQQGNGLKTVIGIPYALGGTEPVLIETGGVRYSIRPNIDPAGAVSIERTVEKVRKRPGTTITVTVPADEQVLWPEHWREGFVLFNPHASISEHAQSGSRKRPDFYTPSVPATWRKPGPRDPTSPHWYDEAAFARLVTAHDNAYQQGEREDLSLTRGFLQTFDGLKSSVKTKEIRDLLSFQADRLSDLAGDHERMAELLVVMQEVTRIPKPAAMGRIPQEHYRNCFDQWFGLRTEDDFWYKRVETLIDGVPWVADVALAATQVPGDVYFGVNYSLVANDPISDTPLEHGPINDEYGLRSFLDELGALPEYETSHRAAAIHIITPTPGFTDRGKSSIEIPDEFADELARAIYLAGKTLYRDKKRRERNPTYAPPRHRRTPPLTEVLLVEPVAGEQNIIEVAFDIASGPDRLPVPAHSLFYQVRPLVQDWYIKNGYEPRVLKPHNFEQNLLVKYQQKFGEIPGLIREPREELMEPHTGTEVSIGTLHVADYEFPDYLYHSIMVVEKRGLKPVWKSVQLGERYDLAIVNGGGEPSEALRTLFQRAENEGFDGRLFVGHDCDDDGYGIAHTMAWETERMLGYHVDVIDLGLSVADAIRLGLPQETHFRTSDLPEWMIPAPGYQRYGDQDWDDEWLDLPGDWKESDSEDGVVYLSRDETRWFVGKFAGYDQNRKEQFACIRVELNAMAVPVMVRFFEEQLAAYGAGAKLIPPTEVVEEEAERTLDKTIQEWVLDTAAEMLDLDGIAITMTDEMADEMLDRNRPRRGPRKWIDTAFKRDRSLSWRSALTMETEDRLKRRDEVNRSRLYELLSAALRSDQ